MSNTQTHTLEFASLILNHIYDGEQVDRSSSTDGSAVYNTSSHAWRRKIKSHLYFITFFFPSIHFKSLFSEWTIWMTVELKAKQITLSNWGIFFVFVKWDLWCCGLFMTACSFWLFMFGGYSHFYLSCFWFGFTRWIICNKTKWYYALTEDFTENLLEKSLESKKLSNLI